MFPNISPKTHLFLRLIIVLSFLWGVSPYLKIEYNKELKIKYEVYLNMLTNKDKIVVNEKNLTEHIDVNFISSLEGTSLVGYIPKEKGVPLGKSGVTVATGFDLGQRNEQDLRILGLNPQLVSKLRPYLGKKKWEADNFLRANPLTLTPKEVDEINKSVFIVKVRGIIREVGETKWQAMSRSLRTVLASVQFQYGSARSRTPNFFKRVLSLDVPSVASYLRSFGDRYRTRRNKEADYLQTSMKDVKKQLLKGTNNV